MFSAFIRRIVFCLLLAAIPVQGMAAAAMLYCCDREGNADTSQVQGDSVHQVHEAAATDQADETANVSTDYAAHAGHDNDHDGNSLHAKCSVCAAFCAGGVIVSSAGGFTAPAPCSSPMAAAPATHFSSFFPDLPERPPLALL